MSSSDLLTIQAKWQSSHQTFPISRQSTVAELSQECIQRFGMETCKMIGLVKGKLPEPATKLETLHPSGATVKLMLIGQPRNTLAALGEQDSIYEANRILESERQAESQRLALEAEQRRRAEQARWEAEEAIRRQEREEQQRIHRLEWEERRRREEAEAREREIRDEQNVNNTIALELIAFHTPAQDSTQKLLLPPNVLQEIVNAKVRFPLTFQVLQPDSIEAVALEAATASTAASHAAAGESNQAESSQRMTDGEEKMDTRPFGMAETSGASSPPDDHRSDSSTYPLISPLVAYYGVQDFTAPTGTVSVPASLLKSLNITDGSRLRLVTVHLKKAKHLVIQPLTQEWTKLPELERRALLEFQLRKHTFIVQDSVLKFNYHPHLPPFEFRVVDTKPEPVVSITDTELSTEILPYESEAETTMNDNSSSSTSSSSSSSSSNRNPSTSSKELPKLVPGEVVTAKMGQNDSITFSLEVTDPNVAITIDVKCNTGDADIYILNTNSIGSTVAVDNFTWSNQSKGSKNLTVSSKDQQFHIGTWQVMIRPFGGPVEANVTVKESTMASASNGHQLSASTSTSSSSSSSTIPPADSVQCDNCGSFISAKSMPMHSLQCARMNHRCRDCGLVVRTSESSKHQTLAHSLYTCICGIQLGQSSMVEHKHSSCPMRLVGCLYCPLQMIVADRGQHQFECGTLHSSCPQCGISMQRKLLRRHFVKEHGGINGKTDEREITFQDFWQ